MTRQSRKRDDALIGPPDLSDSFTEAARTTLAFWTLQGHYNTVVRQSPQGSARVVLVIPGFIGGDITTHNLRGFLKDKGHTAYGWEGGINTGPRTRVLKHLKAQYREVMDRHPDQKIVLIGHSLGGIFARELARNMPESCSQVITLGSPFGAGQYPNATSPFVRIAFQAINGRDHPFLQDRRLARQAMIPPPVPVTSIYSRRDGVVNWRTCLNPKADRVENIEVDGSHCGLVLNPLSLVAIADRLAQPETSWAPFAHGNHPAWPFIKAPAHLGHEPKIPPGARDQPVINIFK